MNEDPLNVSEENLFVTKSLARKASTFDPDEEVVSAQSMRDLEKVLAYLFDKSAQAAAELEKTRQKGRPFFQINLCRPS